YFWATSRVIKDTINEYPLWSLLFADLHAHVFGIPTLLLRLGAAAHFVRVQAAPLASWPRRLVSGLLLGFLGAVQALTNAWEAPLLAGLLLLVIPVAGFLAAATVIPRSGTAADQRVAGAAPRGSAAAGHPDGRVPGGSQNTLLRRTSRRLRTPRGGIDPVLRAHDVGPRRGLARHGEESRAGGPGLRRRDGLRPLHLP